MGRLPRLTVTSSYARSDAFCRALAFKIWLGTLRLEMGGALSRVAGHPAPQSVWVSTNVRMQLAWPQWSHTLPPESFLGWGTLVSHYASSRDEGEAKNDVAGAQE